MPSKRVMGVYYTRLEEIKTWLKYREIYLKAQGRQHFVPHHLFVLIESLSDFKYIREQYNEWERRCLRDCTDENFVEVMAELSYIQDKIDELNYKRS